MGKGGGRKKKGPKFLPDGTPLTNRAKKDKSREERKAKREKEAKKLQEAAEKKAKEQREAARKKGGKKSSKPAAKEVPVLVGGPRYELQRLCWLFAVQYQRV